MEVLNVGVCKGKLKERYISRHLFKKESHLELFLDGFEAFVESSGEEHLGRIFKTLKDYVRKPAWLNQCGPEFNGVAADIGKCKLKNICEKGSCGEIAKRIIFSKTINDDFLGDVCVNLSATKNYLGKNFYLKTNALVSEIVKASKASGDLAFISRKIQESVPEDLGEDIYQTLKGCCRAFLTNFLSRNTIPELDKVATEKNVNSILFVIDKVSEDIDFADTETAEKWFSQCGKTIDVNSVLCSSKDNRRLLEEEILAVKSIVLAEIIDSSSSYKAFLSDGNLIEVCNTFYVPDLGLAYFSGRFELQEFFATNKVDSLEDRVYMAGKFGKRIENAHNRYRSLASTIRRERLVNSDIDVKKATRFVRNRADAQFFVEMGKSRDGLKAMLKGFTPTTVMYS